VGSTSIALHTLRQVRRARLFLLEAPQDRERTPTEVFEKCPLEERHCEPYKIILEFRMSKIVKYLPDGEILQNGEPRRYCDLPCQ
jgi:hypothetical protein